jgi:hypothetical protein
MFCPEASIDLAPHESTMRLYKLLRGNATTYACWFQHHQRSYLEKIWSRLKTEDERNMMEAALMDLNSLEALGYIDIRTKNAQATENK